MNATKLTALGRIPEAWEVGTVGSLLIVAQYGLSVRGESAGAYPILRMNCQINGRVVFDDVQYVDLEEAVFDNFRLVRGDILFNRTNSYELVGRSALYDHDIPAVFASYLIRLQVDESRVNPAYLNYLLNWDVAQRELKKLASRGVSQANINASRLKDFEIHWPAIGEQSKIVQILDPVQSLVDREVALFDAASKVKHGLLHELFMRGLRGYPQKETEIGQIPENWDVVRFGSIRDRLQYGTSTRCTYDSGGLPVLRIPNIQPGGVNAADLKYGKLFVVEAARYRLENGDLIFIRTNGVLDRLGSRAVYSGEPANALFASYLIRAQVNREKVDPYFAAFFYSSELGTGIVAGRATPAADGKYNLNTGAIDSLLLPLPPTLEEQREIVSILMAIDRKIDLHRRKRAVLDELFKALLHKLMTGEIRVTDLDLTAITPSGETEAAA